jgi:hypothetical protein
MEQPRRRAQVHGLHVIFESKNPKRPSGGLEALERGRAKGNISLRRMQWKAAEEGNITAMIWLGKQLLGQRSFEREEKNVPLEIPPLIIQVYKDDEPSSE